MSGSYRELSSLSNMFKMELIGVRDKKKIMAYCT